MFKYKKTVTKNLIPTLNIPAEAMPFEDAELTSAFIKLANEIERVCKERNLNPEEFDIRWIEVGDKD